MVATLPTLRSAPPLGSSAHPHHILVATELGPNLKAPAEARSVVGDLLRQGRRPDLVDVACLLTSELVTNAVIHVGAPIELVVDLDHARLAVEVIDTSSRTPALGEAKPHDTSGRGLELVEELSDCWGITHVRPGKSVWFALGTDSDGAPHRSSPS